MVKCQDIVQEGLPNISGHRASDRTGDGTDQVGQLVHIVHIGEAALRRMLGTYCCGFLIKSLRCKNENQTSPFLAERGDPEGAREVLHCGSWYTFAHATA